MAYDDTPLFMTNIRQQEDIKRPLLRWSNEVLKEKEQQKSDPSPLLQEWINNHPTFDPYNERYAWKKLK